MGTYESNRKNPSHPGDYGPQREQELESWAADLIGPYRDDLAPISQRLACCFERALLGWRTLDQHADRFLSELRETGTLFYQHLNAGILIEESDRDLVEIFQKCLWATSLYLLVRIGETRLVEDSNAVWNIGKPERIRILSAAACTEMAPQSLRSDDDEYQSILVFQTLREIARNPIRRTQFFEENPLTLLQSGKPDQELRGAEALELIGTHSLLAECFSIGLEQRDEVEAGVGRAWYGRAFADLMKRGPRTLLESRMIVPELLAHIFTDPECVLQFQHDLCAREDTFAAAKINFESSLYAPDIEEP